MHTRPYRNFSDIYKNTFQPLCLLLVCLIMSGCAGLRQPTTTPATPTTQTPATAPTWQERHQQLSHVQAWVIQGSTSIQHDNKTDVATLSWTQQSSQYNISLYGPLSLGRVTISGRPGLVSLTQSNKPTVSASNPEQLMQRQLGWQLPISNFYYWVRGIPAPSASYRLQQDNQNRSLQLVQQGWRIQYMEYMRVQQVDLPRRIELMNPRLHVRVVIRNWII